MDKKHQDLMKAMMKQIEEQNKRREAEIKLILTEKDKQIASILQTKT